MVILVVLNTSNPVLLSGHLFPSLTPSSSWDGPLQFFQEIVFMLCSIVCRLHNPALADNQLSSLWLLTLTLFLHRALAVQPPLVMLWLVGRWVYLFFAFICISRGYLLIFRSLLNGSKIYLESNGAGVRATRRDRSFSQGLPWILLKRLCARSNEMTG
jgi:hypothetical protein